MTEGHRYVREYHGLFSHLLAIIEVTRMKFVAKVVLWKPTGLPMIAYFWVRIYIIYIQVVSIGLFTGLV